jgi:hypothetical protein
MPTKSDKRFTVSKNCTRLNVSYKFNNAFKTDVVNVGIETLMENFKGKLRNMDLKKKKLAYP